MHILTALLLAGCSAAFGGQAIEFARDGALKMLYDNRMYPQAVASDGRIFMAWRGAEGLPWVRSYDRVAGELSQPRMLLAGLDIDIDARRFARDQHYAPVIWTEADGHLHAAFGFHRTPGYHLATAHPAGFAAWKRLPEISHSVSYPQVHRIWDGRTLVYFRESGHLGFWTYRTSADGGRTWIAPEGPVIDLDALPHSSPEASHAGSYQTTRAAADGRNLHIAFIWKVEEPLESRRYGGVLHDYTRRHNLYYVRLDLESGQVYNAAGKQLERPVNLETATRECLVWDTAGGSASVGPSIALGALGEPYFVLPVSGDKPYDSTFHFVGRRDGQWTRTPLAPAGHPFNSSLLERRSDGSFRAFLVAGGGHADEGDRMNSYGWGDRIEEWTSDSSGSGWRRSRDLTPTPGLRYQSLKAVHDAKGETLPGLLLFYAWERQGPGRAYLLDAGE